MHTKRTLKNGVKILYEYIPYVRSVSMGIWVKNGSRNELAAENGASHFIEHMLFKGTKTRTARDIAGITDKIGGQINAFTSRECTCFYGRVLDSHLNVLLDVLSDMFFNSRFDEDDIVNERGVIFEEIDMYDDTPDDLASERLFSSVFKGSPLSRPVLGTRKTLTAMTGEFLKDYKARHYAPQNTIIALSGSFKDSDIDAIESVFSSMEKVPLKKVKPASYRPAITAKKKRIEQNHICLGFPGIDVNSEKRFSMQLMSSILGGGSSSRLFQSVRERAGLCYSIFSFSSGYEDTGLFTIYTALNNETEKKALTLIGDELHRFLNDGVTDDELECAREQTKANILMSLESTSSRMNRIARGEMMGSGAMDIEELTERYDAITKTDILEIARNTFDMSQISFSAVGRTLASEEYGDFLRRVM